MRIVIRSIVLVQVVLLCAALSFAAPPPRVRVTVERVTDGDTLVVTSENGTRLRLRLLGIDAPEIAHGALLGQPYGLEARQYLARLVINRPVQVEMFGPDVYRRILAVVWAADTNVNVEMVRSGFAEIYRRARCRAYCRELSDAEVQAQRGRVGMWMLETHESPAAYRKRSRASPHG